MIDLHMLNNLKKQKNILKMFNYLNVLKAVEGNFNKLFLLIKETLIKHEKNCKKVF